VRVFTWSQPSYSLGTENRATIAISDEFDVQDLLRALLRQRFSDVRPEEACTFHGGTSTAYGLFAQAGKNRCGGKDDAEALGIRRSVTSAAGYRSLQGHPDCSILVCFLYDLKDSLRNRMAWHRILKSSPMQS